MKAEGKWNPKHEEQPVPALGEFQNAMDRCIEMREQKLAKKATKKKSQKIGVVYQKQDGIKGQKPRYLICEDINPSVDKATWVKSYEHLGKKYSKEIEAFEEALLKKNDKENVENN
jgi:hypothetical protein